MKHNQAHLTVFFERNVKNSAFFYLNVCYSKKNNYICKTINNLKPKNYEKFIYELP